MKTHITVLLIFLLSFFSTPSFSQFSGLKKWFNKEVIPTIKGDRPLNIDPTRVRLSHNGKDIIRASSQGKGSVYLDLGVAKLQTSDLQKRVSQAVAIYYGDYAVMSQVAYEQFQKQYEKQLKEAQERGEIKVSNTPPSYIEAPEPQTGKEVIIYNHAKSSLSYALNNNLFTIGPESGFKHFSSTGEFYLQFDQDVSEDTKIARYYLTKSAYGLYLFEGMDNIAIQKHY